MAARVPTGLAALLGVRQAEKFLRTAWPNAPFVAHGPVDRLRGLFNPQVARDLDALLALPAQATYAQLRDGARFSNGAVTPQVARALHRAGLSIYCWEVTLAAPGAQRWLAALRRDLSLSAELPRVSIFASRKNVEAPLHFDGQEGFVVQLAGRKEWTIAANQNVRFPTVNHFAADPVPPLLKSSWRGKAPTGFPPLAQRVMMRPGSVMFLPRGTWHATRTIQDSVHLDLMMPLPTWSEVLITQVVERLQRQPHWRAPAVGAQARQLALEVARFAQTTLARFQGAAGSTPASRKHSDR